MAGLVPAISIRMARAPLIEIAGTGPAMTLKLSGPALTRGLPAEAKSLGVYFRRSARTKKPGADSRPGRHNS
jgi:hypothetical protein